MTKSKNKKDYVIATVLSVLMLSVPSITLAIPETFKEIAVSVLSFIRLLVPVLSTAAFIVFFWGLSKFILNSGNEADIRKGKDYMLWGILALFILLTFRAIITLVAGEFQFGTTSPLLQT